LDIDSLLIYANVISAIGTLTLAYFAYKNIKASKVQLKYIQQQTKLFKSMQEPLIVIKDKKFNKNKIILDLINKGGGMAAEIAIKTRFFITKQELDKESRRLLMRTPFKDFKKLKLKAYDRLVHEQGFLVKKDFFNPDGGIFFDTLSWFKKRKLKNQTYYKVYPSDIINFLMNEKGDTILEESQTEKFSTEPLFWFTLVRHKKLEWFAPGKGNSLEEMIKIMKDNKILTFGITFNLVSRDRIGRVIYHEQIDSCIFDVRHHKSIEDAINEGRKVQFTNLGWREIQKRVRWMPASQYEELEFVDR